MEVWIMNTEPKYNIFWKTQELWSTGDTLSKNRYEAHQYTKEEAAQFIKESYDMYSYMMNMLAAKNLVSLEEYNKYFDVVSVENN